MNCIRAGIKWNLTICRAVWFFVVGVLLLIGLCCYCGLLIFATYHECDPLTTKVFNNTRINHTIKENKKAFDLFLFRLKLVKAKDQLLPLLVMDILGDYPGVPGLFVTGVFSAALRFANVVYTTLY